MSLATRLKSAIEASGLSIREFQRRMAATKADGTSYPAINRALHDRGTPSLKFLEVAADLLEVRRAWLMCGDGPMHDNPTLDMRADRYGLAKYFIGMLPVAELEAWLYALQRLELPDRVQATVFRLATTIFDAVEVMRIGEVSIASGGKAYRPSPELRQAMAEHVSSWTGLLLAWQADDGRDAVRAALTRHAAAIGARFVGATKPTDGDWRPPPSLILAPTSVTVTDNSRPAAPAKRRGRAKRKR